MAKKNIKRECYQDEEADVRVYLPLLQDEGGYKVSQEETVTVNGRSTVIHRGVDEYVSLPVYEALCAKFPELRTR